MKDKKRFFIRLATVLVLSGCTSRTDVNGYPYRPTYILNGVGEIVTG